VPSDPVRAYVLARHLHNVVDRSDGERADEAREARDRFLTLWEVRTEGPEGRTALSSPFIRLGLVQEATGADPFFPPALYRKAFSALREGAYEQAIAQLENAVARDPLTADRGAAADAMARATAAFRDGSLQLSQRHLEAAIELTPDLAEPHRTIGLVYLADLQYDNATDALRIAVRLNPADERAPLALAYVLAETNQQAEAEQVLREAIAVLPDSGRARYSLASLYERQERVEAVREFEAAAAFEPLSGLNSLYRTIGRLHFEQRNVGGTIEAYERRIDVHPNDPDAHHLLGEAYEQQGRYDEALAEYAVALLMAPDHQATRAALGDAYLGSGQYAKAVEAARRALELDPGHKDARYTLATALMRLGRTDEGRQELKVFQRLQAEETAAQSRELQLDALRREASISAATQDYEQAVALLRKALVLDPASAASHMSLGLALLGAGQFPEAIERLQTAAALNAPVDVHRHLADAYAAVGQQEDSDRERALYERRRRESAPANR
jgi:tetratricopeptide (TPR) repeat protein